MISFESFDPGAWTVDGMLVKLADVEPVKAVAKKLRQSSDLMAHSLKALVIGSVLATPIATTATPLQWSRTVAAGEIAAAKPDLASYPEIHWDRVNRFVRSWATVDEPDELDIEPLV